MSGSSTPGPVRPAVVPLPVLQREAVVRRMPVPSRARQAPSAGGLARRRWAVRAAKWLLPLAALGLLSAIALWPEFDRAEDRARVSFRRVSGGAEGLRVTDPRYQGVDEANRPFNVTATVAAQVGASNVFDLERPRADLFLTDGAWIFLEAERGRIDRSRNMLDLAGKVTLFHDNGTTMVTDRASVDIGAGAASGDAPVAAQGPFGTLTSDGFSLVDRGKVVVFTGRARAVLEGDQR